MSRNYVNFRQKAQKLTVLINCITDSVINLFKSIVYSNYFIKPPVTSYELENYFIIRCSEQVFHTVSQYCFNKYYQIFTYK